MPYWWPLVARAWLETWGLVSGSPGLSFLVTGLVFVGTLFCVRRFRGRDAMRDELQSVAISLVSTLAVGGAIFVVHLCFVSPFRMYHEMERERAVAQTAAATAKEETKSLADQLNACELRAEAEVERLRDDSQALRDKLADARAARPLELTLPKDAQLPTVAPPVVEGVRWVSESLPSSPHADAPYGLKITIQTNVPLRPVWQLNLVCSAPILKGDYTPPLRGGAGISGGAHGVATTDPKVYVVRETILPFDPDTPVVVRLYAAVPLKMVRLAYRRD